MSRVINIYTSRSSSYTFHSRLQPLMKSSTHVSGRHGPKSRNGCRSCKARKIKCDESKPRCQNCIFRRRSCEYKSSSLPADLTSNQSLTKLLLPSSPFGTTLQGRYFHHFLTITHPFLPSNNEDVWKKHIPQFATYNEAVMSAILGLSAAHFDSMHHFQQHHSAASLHRGKALAGLKQIFDTSKWSRSDVDAAIAISYLLAFQSRLMVDGFLDFFTMARGCALLSEHVINQSRDTSLQLSRQNITPSISNQTAINMPLVDEETIRKGLKDLDSLRHLLWTEAHWQFFGALRLILETCLISNAQGLVEYWKAMDGAVSATFLGTNNVMKLLQSYLVAVKLILDPVVQVLYSTEETAMEREGRHVTVSWGRNIFEQLPGHLRKYVQWSMAVIESKSMNRAA